MTKAELLKRLDKYLEEKVKEVPNVEKMLAINGVGMSTVIGFTAEVGDIGAGLQECSLAMKKQSEAAKTFIIWNDPDKEQRRHPTMGRQNEGI